MFKYHIFPEAPNNDTQSIPPHPLPTVVLLVQGFFMTYAALLLPFLILSVSFN